jgi:hypothetical protein
MLSVFNIAPEFLDLISKIKNAMFFLISGNVM